ncbi:MAG: aspartate aminotransferase, partial [Pseudomonas sp.]|nr:aspartate aminotransferase [Pseudomonas sp.]
AFDGGLEFLRPQVAAYRERRDRLVQALTGVDGLQVLTPDGGFFVFVRCAQLIERVRPDGQPIRNDDDLVDWFLEQGVAVVAGSAYGLSPWFRVSIATAVESVVEAGQRIARACALLQEADA